jgi:hypothetical protein
MNYLTGSFMQAILGPVNWGNKTEFSRQSALHGGDQRNNSSSTPGVGHGRFLNSGERMAGE